MLKVAKFGGSSMADAGQYQKIRDIIRSDPSRRVVVVSAAGKRSAGDNKITDLLYLCYAHLQYGVSCDGIYQMIRERYGDIHRELGLRNFDFVCMAVSNYILNEIVDDPHIAVHIQSYPDRLFGNINVIINLFILKNRYPVNQDISCQLCGLNALDF